WTAAAVAIGHSSRRKRNSMSEEISGAEPARSRRAVSHPQKCTGDVASAYSVLVCGFGEPGLLLLRCFLLVLGLPFVIGHAVDRLAALVLAQRHALGVGGVLHPVGQAVAAEAREIHQVD